MLQSAHQLHPTASRVLGTLLRSVLRRTHHQSHRVLLRRWCNTWTLTSTRVKGLLILKRIIGRSSHREQHTAFESWHRRLLASNAHLCGLQILRQVLSKMQRASVWVVVAEWRSFSVLAAARAVGLRRAYHGGCSELRRVERAVSGWCKNKMDFAVMHLQTGSVLHTR